MLMRQFLRNFEQEFHSNWQEFPNEQLFKMTLYLLVFNGSNLIDKFFNLMAFSKKLLLKIKTKTSEYENALSIIILRMTHFTF